MLMDAGDGQNSGKLISLAARRPLGDTSNPDLIVSSTGNPVTPSQINFDRRELQAILRIYGFKVAAGEWRDYAIDSLKDRALFSVYRRASEAPLYCIEKNPKLARKQGAYSITNTQGAVLKRGHDIVQVLKLFEKQLKLVD
ncbi:MAG: DUF2794 domain-containing protein [Pseudomonadota bacterium]